MGKWLERARLLSHAQGCDNSDNSANSIGHAVMTGPIVTIGAIVTGSGVKGWGAEDWQAEFGERAGFVEYEAGKPRPEAKRQAFEHCVDRWLVLNPPLIPPAFQCVHCGTETCVTDLALALRDCERNAWVHARCHRPFMQARRAQAIAALSRFGIADPQSATTGEPRSMGVAMKGQVSEQATGLK